MNKKILTGIVAGVCLTGISSVAGAAPINLTNWTAEGGGNWAVSSNGTEVTQTINGDPAYFLSDINYLDKKFEGSFKVNTTSDDDFIGIVFGWKNSSDYYLFDWKQNVQNSAKEGYTLSHITGTSVNLWNHTGTDLTVLDSLYGSDKGWADNTSYNFTLDYTSTGFTISVDNVLLFSESGSFSTGKFGFYNYSQGNVTYKGFEETPSAVPEPTTMTLLGAGLILGASGIRRRKK